MTAASRRRGRSSEPREARSSSLDTSRRGAGSAASYEKQPQRDQERAIAARRVTAAATADGDVVPAAIGLEAVAAVARAAAADLVGVGTRHGALHARIVLALAVVRVAPLPLRTVAELARVLDAVTGRVVTRLTKRA